MTFNKLLRFNKDFTSPHTLVRWGGGGDTTSTTSSGISDEFKPELENLIGTAKNEYNTGSLGNVAGTSSIQDTVFGNAAGRMNAGLGAISSGQDTAYDASTGQGLFGLADTTALKQNAVRQAQAAMAPTLDAEASAGLVGGSRAAIASGDRQAQMAGALSGIDYQAGQEQRQNALGGGQALIGGGQAEAGINQGNLGALAQLGDAQRGVAQELADADALALERYSNVFSGLAGGQTESTTNQTGGGK